MIVMNLIDSEGRDIPNLLGTNKILNTPTIDLANLDWACSSGFS